MAWLILILSGIFEAVWATALGISDGLSRPWPTVVFILASGVSLYGLGVAMKTIPMGTAYTVWVGIGGSLTVIWAMLTGTEPVSVIRIILLAGIIVAIAGLKATADHEPAESSPAP